jgi:hypothetical protein
LLRDYSSPDRGKVMKNHSQFVFAALSLLAMVLPHPAPAQTASSPSGMSAEQISDHVQRSVVGTFQTCGPAWPMSVYWGRPEVIAARSW